MSRFFSKRYSELEPYVPGEQPRDMKYIKLNTNESPFPPTAEVVAAAAGDAALLNLYCDPECTVLRQEAAKMFGVKPENLLPVNGSDEILYFAFMAFGDEDHPFAFPEISYGFYPVYAAINHVPTNPIPLKDDLSIDYRDYCGLNQNIVIANPNAPTGIALTLDEIEEIVRTNPDHVVIIDEAYIDFGGESCVPLIQKYENLLVTQTFSKSRSLAGGRLGFGIAGETLMADLNTIKYSVNPYNVNRMTQATGVAACRSNAVYMQNCRTIADNRAYTTEALRRLGFSVPESKANFIFAACDWINGETLYSELKKRGILVRHFSNPKISNYCRITIGTKAQMDALIAAVNELHERIGA